MIKIKSWHRFLCHRLKKKASESVQESLLSLVDTEEMIGVKLFVNRRRGEGNPIPWCSRTYRMHSAIIIIITRDVYFLLCSLGNNFKIQKKVIEVQNRCLPVNFELDPNYDGWTLSEEVHITYICSSRSCSGSPSVVTWMATFSNCHIKTFGNMFLKKY